MLDLRTDSCDRHKPSLSKGVAKGPNFDPFALLKTYYCNLFCLVVCLFVYLYYHNKFPLKERGRRCHKTKTNILTPANHKGHTIQRPNQNSK